jgi:hypothetical protein
VKGIDFHRLKWAFASAALVLLAASAPAGQEFGLHFPEPPRQHSAWRPSAAIPTNILSAARALFDQGFPDPRGCEYQEFEVEVSGVWSDKISLVKTRGWVLPAKRNQGNRFAICWNGLIYPATNIAAKADLSAEITNRPSWSGGRFNSSAAGEQQTVIFSHAVSTRVLLLLRAGEAEIALKNWAPNPRQGELASRRSGPAATESNDPYLEFAGDWAWALFDRTICAHMRGNTPLALATARQLAAAQPKIETEAAERGFRHQQYFDSPRSGKEKPYLEFLEQLPQLLADLERRAAEQKTRSDLESGLPNLTNQSARIAALIADLDCVHARQWGQPGSVNLPEDPIVAALIQEGDAAVEPLLDCLDTDKRFTRSVGFGRDFFRGRTVIPVRSAARVAIETILQAGFGGGATEIRAYWNKYKGFGLDERCYEILKDDSAGARWLEAAAHIVQPETVTTYPGGFSTSRPAPTNAPIRLRGEALRSKSDPSVAEIMTRRALEVPANNPNAYSLSAACDMGLRLAEWDSAAAAPVVKVLAERCSTAMEFSGQRLGPALSKLTMVRAKVKDSHAFEEYAKWLKTAAPETLEHDLLQCLEPLTTYPDDPALGPTAETLFNNTNSPWYVLPWKGPGFQNPVESGLVNVPAFRRLLARELEKQTACGSIEWRAPNTISYQLTNHMSGSRGANFPEESRPANGTKADLRWCDWIAWLLSNSKQVPFFNPFAPVEKRDEEIMGIKALLERR